MLALCSADEQLGRRALRRALEEGPLPLKGAGDQSIPIYHKWAV